MIIEDLAREAGIGKGSVYLHFRSKEEVVLAVVDTEVDAVLASLTLIAGSDEPARERLKAMVLHRVLDRFDRFRVFSSSLHDLLASLRPALLERRDEQLRREADAFVRVLRDGIKSAEFIPMNAREVASAILTSTNSLLPYYLSPRELGERANLQRRAGVIADLAYRAVSAATRPRGSKLSEVPRR